MIVDSHVHLKHGAAERTEYSPEAERAMILGGSIAKLLGL